MLLTRVAARLSKAGAALGAAALALMIALITLVVAHLPLLILGSLLVENFFGIPGLGNLLVTAIQTSDLAVVRATTFLTSILYIIGLTLTDICYALVDPRIRLS